MPTDARTGRRFPLELPIRVGDSPAAAELVGKTANLSTSGAYLWVDGPIEEGAIIEFEVTIPKETIGAKKDAVLRCVARVVRTDKNARGKKNGVACVIEAYEFVRGKRKSRAKQC